ncbi:hypothetical protein ABFV57_30410, partial [Pseudomonas neuropathica]|uniref:hypothetical protein n=1 Tax=Pseudomonas neuropathica TaxID=2730425 RepID=UPI0034D75B2C
MKTNTIAVNLNDRKLRKYGKSDEAEIIGEFYNYKTPEPTLKTIQHIQKKIDCPEDLVRHLQSLTGFYSLVIRDKNKIFAVVDITRSIPLL